MNDTGGEYKRQSAAGGSPPLTKNFRGFFFFPPGRSDSKELHNGQHAHQQKRKNHRQDSVPVQFAYRFHGKPDSGKMTVSVGSKISQGHKAGSHSSAGAKNSGRAAPSPEHPGKTECCSGCHKYAAGGHPECISMEKRRIISGKSVILPSGSRHLHHEKRINKGCKKQGGLQKFWQNFRFFLHFPDTYSFPCQLLTEHSNIHFDNPSDSGS